MKRILKRCLFSEKSLWIQSNSIEVPVGFFMAILSLT
jgi:hypothetical protein